MQEDEPLNQPGYYWLAYEWENLYLSCEICNQKHKKNYFPLEDNSKRAKSHKEDVAAEKPLFIHPANENPEEFISFKDEVPVAVNGNLRGVTTIKNIGIDREKLNDKRREVLNPIRDLYDIAKIIPETPPEIKAKAWQVVKSYYEKSKLEETEYASMLRCFFKANPLPAGV